MQEGQMVWKNENDDINNQKIIPLGLENGTLTQYKPLQLLEGPPSRKNNTPYTLFMNRFIDITKIGYSNKNDQQDIYFKTSGLNHGIIYDEVNKIRILNGSSVIRNDSRLIRKIPYSFSKKSLSQLNVTNTLKNDKTDYLIKLLLNLNYDKDLNGKFNLSDKESEALFKEKLSFSKSFILINGINDNYGVINTSHFDNNNKENLMEDMNINLYNIIKLINENISTSLALDIGSLNSALKYNYSDINKNNVIDIFSPLITEELKNKCKLLILKDMLEENIKLDFTNEDTKNILIIINKIFINHISNFYKNSNMNLKLNDFYTVLSNIKKDIVLVLLDINETNDDNIIKLISKLNNGIFYQNKFIFPINDLDYISLLSFLQILFYNTNDNYAPTVVLLKLIKIRLSNFLKDKENKSSSILFEIENESLSTILQLTGGLNNLNELISLIDKYWIMSNEIKHDMNLSFYDFCIRIIFKLYDSGSIYILENVIDHIEYLRKSTLNNPNSLHLNYGNNRYLLVAHSIYSILGYSDKLLASIMNKLDHSHKINGYGNKFDNDASVICLLRSLERMDELDFSDFIENHHDDLDLIFSFILKKTRNNLYYVNNILLFDLLSNFYFRINQIDLGLNCLDALSKRNNNNNNNIRKNLFESSNIILHSFTDIRPETRIEMYKSMLRLGYAISPNPIIIKNSRNDSIRDIISHRKPDISFIPDINKSNIINLIIEDFWNHFKKTELNYDFLIRELIVHGYYNYAAKEYFNAQRYLNTNCKINYYKKEFIYEFLNQLTLPFYSKQILYMYREILKNDDQLIKKIQYEKLVLCSKYHKINLDDLKLNLTTKYLIEKGIIDHI